MSSLWMDSFDDWAAADASLYYADFNGVTLNSTAGRNGTNGFSSTGGYVAVDVNNKQTIISGFSFTVDRVTTALGDHIVLDLRDGTTIQCALHYQGATGKFFFSRNGVTQLGGLSTTVIAPNVKHYIEVKMKIDNTTGTCELRVDGNATAEIALTGQDTQQTANAYCTRVRLTLGQNNYFSYADDWYVNDDAGSRNNDFEGDVRVDSLAANGNGATSNFVGSDGNSTDNYLLVDETTPNADTDYVQSATLNDIDTYTMANLPSTTGNPKAVMTILIARKDDAGTRQIAPVLRHSGTNYVGNTKTLATSYSAYYDINETNPGTATDWTIADVNGIEAGQKVIA